MFKPTPEMREILIKSGNLSPETRRPAANELAKAFTLPLREGLLSGDILDGIFQMVDLQGAKPEFPLSFLAPGTEKDFVAYSIPNQGYLPHRVVEGDYIMVNTYEVGNSIDWLYKYARDARWDIVGKALEVLRAGFVKKLNDDGFHTLLAAGVDRNLLVYDDDAPNGTFSKKLVSSMKTVMRRNGGGNSTSMNRFKLTDLYTSPECQEDIRNWNIDEVDEVTRRELLVGDGGLLVRLYQVNLHDIDELGDDQEYQLYYEQQLGGTLPSGDSEIVIGLDLTKGQLVMPMGSEVEVFMDDSQHRSRKQGAYAWGEFGFGCLDGRVVLLGSC